MAIWSHQKRTSNKKEEKVCFWGRSDRGKGRTRQTERQLNQSGVESPESNPLQPLSGADQMPDTATVLFRVPKNRNGPSAWLFIMPRNHIKRQTQIF